MIKIQGIYAKCVGTDTAALWDLPQNCGNSHKGAGPVLNLGTMHVCDVMTTSLLCWSSFYHKLLSLFIIVTGSLIHFDRYIYNNIIIKSLLILKSIHFSLKTWGSQELGTKKNVPVFVGPHNQLHHGRSWATLCGNHFLDTKC